VVSIVAETIRLDREVIEVGLTLNAAARKIPAIRRAAHVIVLILAGTLGLAGAAAGADTVAFDVDFAGTKTRVSAYLDRPDGDGPFPAVIILHGCTGLEKKEGGWIWAGIKRHERFLRQAGFVTLIVDSHGSRGMSTALALAKSCWGGKGYAVRVEDSYAALAFLEGLPIVRRGAVSAVGFSQGGGVVLRALDLGRAGREEGALAAGVAFYPPCEPTGGLYAPLLILIGGADNITPQSACQTTKSMASQAVHGSPLDMFVYPGAHHAFDFPLDRRIKTPMGTIAPDRDAFRDAQDRMLRYLRRAVGQ